MSYFIRCWQVSVTQKILGIKLLSAGGSVYTHDSARFLYFIHAGRLCRLTRDLPRLTAIRHCAYRPRRPSPATVSGLLGYFSASMCLFLAFLESGKEQPAHIALQIDVSL